MRVGNGAFSQRQNDVYGALVDSLYIHTKARPAVPPQIWPIVADQVESGERAGSEPDQGIWEARGEPKHYVSSKLMCWVAVDRGARLATRRGEDERRRAWREIADEIHAEILERGVSRRASCASTTTPTRSTPRRCSPPLLRFLPPDHEVIRATVLAIAEELTEHGLVLRYRVDETDDGLHGEEGTFTICSFWLVSALSEIGEARARASLCERLLASPARSASTPRRSSAEPAATSATSPRPSPTWR